MPVDGPDGLSSNQTDLYPDCSRTRHKTKLGLYEDTEGTRADLLTDECVPHTELEGGTCA